MVLIAGLGNPGEQYEKTRHNIGFRVIDALIKELNAQKQSDKGFQGELYKSTQILLLKPTTFMNASGISLQSVVAYYKPKGVIVIHDDLDLGFGVVKFKYGGGNAGHNGLKSIDSLYGKEYYKIRYGIGKPAQKSRIIHWVLENFTPQEEEQNAILIPHCSKAALAIAKLESPKELSEKISNYFTLNLQEKSQLQKQSQHSPNNQTSNNQSTNARLQKLQENPKNLF